MLTTCSDIQSIGEVDSAAFGAVQQGATNAQFMLKNSGINTINYRFQFLNGSTWQDLGLEGTIYNNTLATDEVIQVSLTDLPAQIQLMCNASGGSVLFFEVTRYFNWTVGGFLPLLSAS